MRAINIPVQLVRIVLVIGGGRKPRVGAVAAALWPIAEAEPGSQSWHIQRQV